MDDATEIERLRELVGPSETSYAALLDDRDHAVKVAREATVEAGELRGHIVELSVQLSRARQEQEYQQISAVMGPAERLAFRARRRWATSASPRLAYLVRRVRHAMQR